MRHPCRVFLASSTTVCITEDVNAAATIETPDYDMTDVDGRLAYAQALIDECGSRYARAWCGRERGEVRIYTGKHNDYIAIRADGSIEPEFCGGSANQDAKFAKWDRADDVLSARCSFRVAASS